MLPTNNSSRSNGVAASKQTGFVIKAPLSQLTNESPILEVRFNSGVLKIKIDGKEAPFIVRQVSMNNYSEPIFLQSNIKGRMRWPLGNNFEKSENTSSLTLSVLSLVGVLIKVEMKFTMEQHLLYPTRMNVDIISQNLAAQEFMPTTRMISVKPVNGSNYEMLLPKLSFMNQMDSEADVLDFDGKMEYVEVVHTRYLNNLSH